MIQQLSTRYRKSVAASLFFFFYMGLLLPAFSYSGGNRYAGNGGGYFYGNYPGAFFKKPVSYSYTGTNSRISAGSVNSEIVTDNMPKSIPSIGGPSQPEMSAFKSVGVDNLVNLFTGDFSYNIPLLDVGGYPVNIFYDGGVGMEQEASWVGLGWNINPGTVSRNMRGIPDDFNGEEKLIQTQDMKPNISWGVNLGADLETIGIQAGGGATLGVSFNNYLGPALETGVKGSVTANIIPKSGSEKSSALSLKLGITANASSRSGVTFSPSVSLVARAYKDDKTNSIGLGTNLSTSFNSRTGIKALQLSEQMSYNYRTYRYYGGLEYNAADRSASGTLASTSISFSKPSYIPTMRNTLTNKAFSGRFELGAGIFGLKGSAEVEVYKQTSKIADNDKKQIKPMVGYLFLENAKDNANAVMDFTRFNDNEVTPTTPIISVPQYSYDVFSIQGEGTGGSIRAYRNDEGYVRDNKTGSRDESYGAGGDIGLPGHYGASFNMVKTPSTIGEWNAGNKLRNTIGFKGAQNGSWENVYFRNPGETSVLTADQYDRIGGTDLVRYKLGGTDKSPTIEPVLERFTKQGYPNGTANITAAANPERKKRTQVISFLNAKEAAETGLDKKIKNYDATTWLNTDNTLKYTEITRYETVLPSNETDEANLTIYRRPNHISQINVTEADGQRYVYGIPVYNIRQKDFTFTVPTEINDREKDKVDFSEDNTTNISSVDKKDNYIQTTITPAYAHSFLLSGLLSPDYVDVGNDGITDDDLGGAVKFNYTKMNELSRWRTPLTAGTQAIANFNAGKRTEIKDDKGIVSFGIREAWYLHSIESKTMIAFFKLDTEVRKDGKGAGTGNGLLKDGELTGINASDNSSKRLKQIDLYNKADLKKNGIAGAKPVKSVHFEYSYNLCKGTPNNTTSGQGKLTLEKIYFTFNGKQRASKNQYVFSYGAAPAGPTAAENPDYEFNASDRWGTYKPAAHNPADGSNNMRNADFPYSLQDKTLANANAGAWMLKKILLPSGGQIEVDYESDDYAFVQNKRAAIMTKVLGFGSSRTAVPDKYLYSSFAVGIEENDYVFIRVSDACNSTEEVLQKYLLGVDQLSFKLKVLMPGGYYEYINSYATIDHSNPGGGYGRYEADADKKTIWIKLNRVDDISPLSLTAIEFLREQLPGQAYPGYDVQGEPGLQQIGDMLAGWFDGLTSAFKNPVKHLREQSFASEVDLDACFVRLNEPHGIKFGGGHRVKSVKLKDNWRAMNNNTLYTSEYGKEYDYTTKEIFNGTERSISSGVASYEPSLGGDENPFQTMVQISNKIPLGPASYGSVEMPVLDAFFPAPSVGYSKVTVRSIKKGTPNPNQKPKSGIGKQVTEFYTAKDFPVYYNYTPLDPASDKQANSSNLGIFFYKYTFDSRALSQGFIVATNDMHGKMKSQASYPENDETTPLNYTENFYRNTGEKELGEKFQFVNGLAGGTITEGNMGIDIELMTDTREFAVRGISVDVQAQLDLFPVFGIAPWFAFIWPVAGTNENIYRAVTTTKVISYHSILDRVVVIDKGSQVSTENLVYDAETGTVVVNRTNNEYKKPIYSTTYPAYWAYSGMGLAYKNTDAKFEHVNIRDGKITSGNVPDGIFESGDELYITNEGDDPDSDPCNSSLNLFPAPNKRLWVFENHKNTTSLILPFGTAPDFYLMDEKGRLFTRKNVSFRIIRSGKRNMLGAALASTVSMESPVVKMPGLVQKLRVAAASKVVSAAASEFREKWQTDSDIFSRYTDVSQSNGPDLLSNGNFSGGYTGFSSGYNFNPSNGAGVTEGNFNVAANPSNWYSYFFSNCGDHTTGNGNMLMANGVGVSNTTVWSQTVPVEAGKKYAFSFWITSLTGGNNPAALEVLINNTPVGTTYKAGNGFTCNWDNFIAAWNSGTSTSATIVIKDNNLDAQGNDFAIDDLSFYMDNSCSSVPQLSCDGILEKEINPYRKGILGVFRGGLNKVYYGSRTETDPSAATNISLNGYLDDFKLYWDYDASNNLIADNTASSKWVFQSQVTKYNSKGLELETKDALNIYTAAQYGFNKTMPVAIANNSSYGQMFAEGFEDDDYKESLTVATTGTSCIKKHISFKELDNATVKDIGEDGFSAHSGKMALKVLPNSTAVKAIPVNGLPGDDFQVKLDDISGLTTVAPYISATKIFNLPTTPIPLNEPAQNSLTILSGSQTLGLLFNVHRDVPYGHPNVQINNGIATLNLQYQIKQYFKVIDPQTYSFTLNTHQLVQRYHPEVNESSPVNGEINRTGLQIEIRKITGEVVMYKVIYSDQNDIPLTWNNTSSAVQSVFLPCGDYVIESKPIVHAVAAFNPPNAPNPSGFWNFLSEANYTCNPPLYSYAPGCLFKKPIPATEEMLNPEFSLMPGKKMLFSAWIKEVCSTPCDKTDFNKSDIQIWCGGVNVGNGTVKRTGAVIEGWQKIEGSFEIPAGTSAAAAEIRFINTNTQPMYVDDIRIHPYNANMKSYVYDPVNLRLVAQQDANNYTSFYEYDDEGTLIRTKVETQTGIKTLTETRSAKQKSISTIQ